MKKILLMAFVALGIAAMTSCTQSNADLIIGTWDVNLQNSYTGFTYGGESERYTLAELDVTAYTFTFDENGELTVNDEQRGMSFTDYFDYVVEGDSMFILDGDSSRSAYAILALDKKNLVLENTDNTMLDSLPASFVDHLEMTRAK